MLVGSLFAGGRWIDARRVLESTGLEAGQHQERSRTILIESDNIPSFNLVGRDPSTTSASSRTSDLGMLDGLKVLHARHFESRMVLTRFISRYLADAVRAQSFGREPLIDGQLLVARAPGSDSGHLPIAVKSGLREKDRIQSPSCGSMLSQRDFRSERLCSSDRNNVIVLGCRLQLQQPAPSNA